LDGLAKRLETYCRHCAVCQAVQHGKALRHGLMQRYEAIGPGDRIHVDLTGPHPASRQGSIYVLRAIDAFGRFLVAVPLRDKSAVTVATALAQHVFLPFESCRSMVSDQGTDFCNDVLQELTRVIHSLFPLPLRDSSRLTFFKLLIICCSSNFDSCNAHMFLIVICAILSILSLTLIARSDLT
jgi:hypothetical protein